jgi:hypothetical protein
MRGQGINESNSEVICKTITQDVTIMIWISVTLSKMSDALIAVFKRSNLTSTMINVDYEDNVDYFVSQWVDNIKCCLSIFACLE